MSGKLPRVLPRFGSGRPLTAGQRQRQAHDHLDGPALGRKVRDPCQVAVATTHRLDRCRQHTVRVARRDSDPDAADVDG